MTDKKFDKRNYIANLTNNTSKIDELMKQLFVDSKSGKLLKNINLRKIWKETAGEAIDRETVKIYERDGKLFVKLRSAAAKSEIMLIKENLLTRFNEQYEGFGIIKNIVLL